MKVGLCFIAIVIVNTNCVSVTLNADYSEKFHIVKAGDSMGKIAGKYGVSVKELQTFNGLTSAVIIPGMKLILSEKAVMPQLPPKTGDRLPVPVLMNSGEIEKMSFDEIALMYGSKKEWILAANGIKSELERSAIRELVIPVLDMGPSTGE